MARRLHSIQILQTNAHLSVNPRLGGMETRRRQYRISLRIDFFAVEQVITMEANFFP